MVSASSSYALGVLPVEIARFDDEGRLRRVHPVAPPVPPRSGKRARSTSAIPTDLETPLGYRRSSFCTVESCHNLPLTSAGPLDILGGVGAHRDYAALLLRSRYVELGKGLAVRVLDLDALIETKREGGCEKDRAVLPILSRSFAESMQGNAEANAAGGGGGNRTRNDNVLAPVTTRTR